MNSAQKDIRLINEDCSTALKKIDTSSVNLVVTDPPYNLGLFMKNRDTNINALRTNHFCGAGWDNLSFPDWITEMDKFFKSLYSVVKDGGSLIVFMSIIKVESIISIAEKNGFYYKTTGIWHKTNPMPRNMKLQFVNSTETWLYFTKKSKTGTFNNKNIVIHDFIETSITPLSEKKYGKHPTQKPEKLITFFVDILSNSGDTVLDAFMGTGVTGVVSKKLGRKFIGIEIDKSYYQIAKKRINEV